MAKKERLGTDPFKGGSLGWIQDTREEKKAEINKNDNIDVKTSKRHETKKPAARKRHTIYLTAAQSKKLRVYAAANDIQMSEVVEKLINDNL